MEDGIESVFVVSIISKAFVSSAGRSLSDCQLKQYAAATNAAIDQKDSRVLGRRKVLSILGQLNEQDRMAVYDHYYLGVALNAAGCAAANEWSEDFMRFQPEIEALLH